MHEGSSRCFNLTKMEDNILTLNILIERTMKPKDNDYNINKRINEAALINHRITWLIASQSILFAGYAILVSSSKFESQLIQDITQVFVFVGKSTALLIFVGIVAACLAVFFIWNDSHVQDPKRGLRICTTVAGLSPAVALPIVFFFAWMQISKIFLSVDLDMILSNEIIKTQVIESSEAKNSD